MSAIDAASVRASDGPFVGIVLPTPPPSFRSERSEEAVAAELAAVAVMDERTEDCWRWSIGVAHLDIFPT